MFSTLLSLIVGQSAMAQTTVRWENEVIRGAQSSTLNGHSVVCSNQDVFTGYAGNQFSIIYTNFGLTLFANQGPTILNTALTTVCEVGLNLIVPRGFQVESLGQTLIGGMIKDPDTAAAIQAQTFAGMSSRVDDRITNIVLSFPRGQVLDASAPPLQRTQNYIFSAQARNGHCIATRNRDLKVPFYFKVTASGIRYKYNQNLIMSVNSNDVALELSPVLKRCP